MTSFDDGDNDPMTAFGRKVDRRFRAVDDRVDATRTQIDQLRADISAQIADARRSLLVLVIWTVFGCSVATAVLCLVTLVLLL